MARKKDEFSYLKAKYKISTSRKLTEIKAKYSTPQDFEDAVAKDPYWMLVKFLNKNFKQADELAIRLFPVLKTSAERCKWVCYHFLSKNESEGNTRMSAKDLAMLVWKDYREVKDFIFDVVTKEDIFYYDAESKNVALAWTHHNEQKIANVIKNKLANPEILDIDWHKYTNVDGFELTDEQKQILELACTKNIMMLNGSAGTGKTSCMKALVNMAEDNGYGCTILAPTGIAAKRIAEVTNHEASTIHRFMARQQTPADFLIIDEMSMVGVSLLGDLFTNIPDYVKIVFICDEAQLPSISCGNIVQNIIDSGVMPMVNLTKVFRYGIGGIATIATDVRMGRNINADSEFDDYHFQSVSNEPLTDIINAYDALRTRYNEDEIMILSPFNVRSSGTYAINKAIQSKYNPNDIVETRKIGNDEIGFKIGDRVVNTENNYHMIGEYNSDIAIMNGEIGKIASYDGEFMAVDYETGRAYLERADIYKQLLAYCITIHKSQGSQAKAVIVICDKSHGFFLNRNLVYVALSRAQKELIFIGDVDIINESLKREENKIRNTWLKEMLAA